MTHRAGSTGQHSGRYAVRLAGHLHPRWTARFDGMALTHLDDGTTLLEGDIADQAALHGLLRTLRDLGCCDHYHQRRRTTGTGNLELAGR